MFAVLVSDETIEWLRPHAWQGRRGPIEDIIMGVVTGLGGLNERSLRYDNACRVRPCRPHLGSDLWPHPGLGMPDEVGVCARLVARWSRSASC
jgi:hypothetical protein